MHQALPNQAQRAPSSAVHGVPSPAPVKSGAAGSKH
jgi:hypothetical protein